MIKRYPHRLASEAQPTEYAIFRLNQLLYAGYQIRLHASALINVCDLAHPNAPPAELFSNGSLVIGSFSDQMRFEPTLDDQRRFEAWVSQVKPHWFTKARREGLVTSLAIMLAVVLVYRLVRWVIG